MAGRLFPKTAPSVHELGTAQAGLVLAGGKGRALRSLRCEQGGMFRGIVRPKKPATAGTPAVYARR